jgi:hypothetical protein
MLQRLERTRHSIADVMIESFGRDEGLKESLKLLECAIDAIERNPDHSEELGLLQIAKLGLREKILLLAYD